MVIGSELKEVLKQILIDQGLQAVGEKMIAMKIRLKNSLLPWSRTLPWTKEEVLQMPVETEVRKFRTWERQMSQRKQYTDGTTPHVLNRFQCKCQGHVMLLVHPLVVSRRVPKMK